MINILTDLSGCPIDHAIMLYVVDFYMKTNTRIETIYLPIEDIVEFQFRDGPAYNPPIKGIYTPIGFVNVEFREGAQSLKDRLIEYEWHNDEIAKIEDFQNRKYWLDR